MTNEGMYQLKLGITQAFRHYVPWSEIVQAVYEQPGITEVERNELIVHMLLEKPQDYSEIFQPIPVDLMNESCFTTFNTNIEQQSKINE